MKDLGFRQESLSQFM